MPFVATSVAMIVTLNELNTERRYHCAWFDSTEGTQHRPALLICTLLAGQWVALELFTAMCHVITFNGKPGPSNFSRI